MPQKPGVLCNGWLDGENIPVAYSAPIAPNVLPSHYEQPQNWKPTFRFVNIPTETQMIALVVHDILDGEPVNGERPGWTHYTALFNSDGVLIEEGETSEESKGWLGPYPEVKGEYHTTAYFLSKPLAKTKINRLEILQHFALSGLGSANLIGKYQNPLSQ